MRSRLERFIQDHREEFDSELPPDTLWGRVQEQLKGPEEKVVKIVPAYYRWIAAAAIAGAVFLTVLLMVMNDKPDKPVANNSTPNLQEQELIKEINPGYAEEVHHFTRLIELKQNQLKQIEKDQPELYKKFIHEITELDSNYNQLKGELADNPNREQLLEAMIQNLRLQAELLNQQLSVIQKIKKEKMKRDENNSKSI